MEDIVVQHSDTQGTPFGYGTYGSRTASVGGTAIKAAARSGTRRTLRRAHARGAPDDIEFDGGEYFVKGSARQGQDALRRSRFALDLAFDSARGVMEPYLDETAYYDTPNSRVRSGRTSRSSRWTRRPDRSTSCGTSRSTTWASRSTRSSSTGRSTAASSRASGQALWEGRVYDEDGQLLAGSLPTTRCRAPSWFPDFEARRDGDAVAGQPAGRQGRRRGRHDRVHGGGVQRRHRRAARRWASALDMPLTPRAVWRAIRPRREARHDPRGVRVHRAGSARRSASIARRPGAKLLAGGQSLIPLMKLRLARPTSSSTSAGSPSSRASR